MNTTSKTLIFTFAAFLASHAAFANPVISDVAVRQRWPWSRLVDIDYVLTCDPSERVDIALEAKDGTLPLALPSGSLSGTFFAVGPGLHRIVWDPTLGPYTNNILTQFNVTLTPTLVPLYIIVDLTKSAGAAGQFEYVTEADLRAGVWGTWEENPVTNNGVAIQSVIWTGVTNDLYRTDKLVLRRIPAGTFSMGSPVGEIGRNATTPERETQHQVTLTKGFYVGVFSVTQKQYERVMGTTPALYKGDTRPVEQVSYTTIRGTSAGVNWPASDAVDTTSFMGRLRTSTGLKFDLPMDAQWEYACRAGTTTGLNSGTNLTNATTCPNMAEVGRYASNTGDGKGGYTSYHTTVGSYLPNAWGLYDMHGNVFEWCLDRWTDNLGTGAKTDPVGNTGGTDRVIRGGHCAKVAWECRSAHRAFIGQTSTSTTAYLGFRAAIQLP